MNRHSKFYAELSNLLDEDEEVYDEGEEEYEAGGNNDYYEDGEDDGEYYEEEDDDDGYGLSPSTDPPTRSAQATFNAHTTISADKDADFELLDQLLPVMHETWKSKAPTQLPLTELEAVRAIRESNYDLEAAVPALLASRSAEKMKSGTSARVLVVRSAQKHETTEVVQGAAVATAAATAAAAASGEPETPEASTDNAKAPPAHKAKTDKKNDNKHSNVQPDTAKPDCTFVVAGHVDAGKSTTLGHLLLLLGYVDAAEVEQNERKGKNSHKESFKYAWLLDQSEEERRRGITIDAGSYCFETSHRRIHILDAPGHKDFIVNMINSATQADAAMLVVTAAPSEFETGLRFGTKDHLTVLKTLGVGCVIVVVNKMDAAGYAKERYDYVVQEVKLLLKQLHLKESVISGYVPISGMEGTNMLTVDRERTPWYEGPSLVELIDNCSFRSRLLDAPLRLSLQDIQGNILYARVESGKLSRGTSLRFVPDGVTVDAKSIDKPTVSRQVDVAFAGDTIEIHTTSSLKGLHPGTLGITAGEAYTSSNAFEAHVLTFPSLAKSILPGATFTLCVHALNVPVKAFVLVSKMDGKGNWSTGMVKCVPPNTQALIVFRTERPIAVMPAEDCSALGRFVLQQDGDIVAGGLVKKVMNPL